MIEGKNITLSLGGKPILRDLSLSVQAGELLAVCGPNGAGKSTLLAALAGEHASCLSSITYDGTRAKTLSAQELSQRRVVLEQKPTLTAEFTVIELVELGVPLGIAPEDMPGITTPILEMLDLTEMKTRFVSELSGGQQHKAHLARVLTQLRGNRELAHTCHLFLDEPTASLDIGQQAKVLRLTRHLVQQGIGVLVVLHDLNLAAAFADRVILMRDGQILFSDTPQAVLTETRLSETYDTAILVETSSSGQTIVQPRL